MGGIQTWKIYNTINGYKEMKTLPLDIGHWTKEQNKDYSLTHFCLEMEGQLHQTLAGS